MLFVGLGWFLRSLILPSGTKGQRFESSRAYEASVEEPTLFHLVPNSSQLPLLPWWARKNQLVGKLVGKNF
ncbi:MAG: hypothetical protein AUI91_07590 [Acidobacteria bacterium 13_1_40CM_3_56_11]|nr:MAG: hypothetical protein AUH28_00315 [Acidobacteria bacterium 13_1_40CM_56_16]OLD19999.1 MAG: hypothetical protein AUI91_07590 [Acidobacteria bacterium 13_1_40CM_3_56_11]OLD68333.1 MAG: hypothetical protein AUI45_10870 [Acidobacteria bacterium 13_1_40CM_2_56_11]